MNNQAFQIGDVVNYKSNRPYPNMRIIDVIRPGYYLCEWYNKSWKKWEQTPFNSSELVKK